MGGRRPTGLPLRTQQETEETLWGSQRPTLEEIIHKCLCKATCPPPAPGHLPAELYMGTFALQALHRDKPTPASRLLTGAVTGHEIESKANEKAASRPRSPPWGIQGRRLACSPKVDPHRWPMFHGCGDKSGHRESELSPRPNQIPVRRRALPFPSRTPVTIGNLRESQPHPPPTPQISPVHAALMGMARMTVTSPPSSKRNPNPTRGGPGHIPGAERSPRQAVIFDGAFQMP